MKIGLIGTGLMGQPMAKRLLQAGFPVTAYNRTRSKLAPLADAGAKIADSPAATVEAADCLILMLTNKEAIEETLLSNAYKSLAERTVIQMGTIAPSESQALGETVAAAGGDYLEAPVLGSIPQVESGELLVMVGATPAQFERWSVLLKHFGPEPMHIGPVGTAAATKLALNQLIAALTGAFALSFGFVQRQGVDVEKFMQILRQSALYAPTFDKKLQRMSDRNFTNPNFPTKHLLKDIDLFLTEAQQNGLAVSSLEGVRHVVQQAVESGWADSDYSSLYCAVNPEIK
ncbi:MAG: NAD(P)-dependent oxidoreductase [Cyanophyceae cyanobacterium]